MTKRDIREEEDWNFRNRDIWNIKCGWTSLEWAQNVKIIILDVNAHQSAYAMETLNN